jgi:hypothetical protein
MKQITRILLAVFAMVICATGTIYSQCGTPLAVNVSNINQTTADLIYSCSGCPATYSYILEYGPTGFVPGTGAASGVNGTVVPRSIGTNTYTATGLTSSTTYDYYVRINCSGTYTANSVVRVFTTAFDCATATPIACNTLVNVVNTPGPGAWSTCTFGYAKEKVYSFTPTVSGIHTLVAPFPNTQIYFAYKAASGGCTETGWTCIGLTQPTSMNQLTFGPLSAGTTYFIIVDHNNPSHPLNSSFRIECPYCTTPVNVTTVNVAPSSVSLSWTGNASIIEYGPNNFVPGTGTTPGTNGTIVNVSGTSGTINNLTSGTLYNFYLRNNCGAGNFSPNSIKISAATYSCPSFTPLSMATWYGLGATGPFPSMYNNYPGCNMFTPGAEHYFRFTPSSSGIYTVKAAATFGSYYNLLARTATTGCAINTFSCMNIASNDGTYDYYSWGPLTAGQSYELMFQTYSHHLSRSAGHAAATLQTYLNTVRPVLHQEQALLQVLTERSSITFQRRIRFPVYYRIPSMIFISGRFAEQITRATLL